MSDKIVIRTFTEEFEVRVAKMTLQEHGIESWILNKKDSAYIPIGYIELYVDERDHEKASEILKEL
jgi:hypothetical protein